MCLQEATAMPLLVGTIWGSHYIQNSCVLKYLPSRLTTKTLITLATGSKHSESETWCLQNKGYIIARGWAWIVKLKTPVQKWVWMPPSREQSGQLAWFWALSDKFLNHFQAALKQCVHTLLRSAGGEQEDGWEQEDPSSPFGAAIPWECLPGP